MLKRPYQLVYISSFIFIIFLFSHAAFSQADEISSDAAVITAGQKLFDGDEFNHIQSFKSSELMRILDEQKDLYDFIILDSAPVNQYSDTRILSSMVDGIILVVKSGKTRRQVVARAKDIIMESGGNILGVVLNKTKHYIPDWIYKKL